MRITIDIVRSVALNVIAMLLFASMLLFMMMLVMTPEKTERGEYTKFVSYWFDQAYYEENFKILERK